MVKYDVNEPHAFTGVTNISAKKMKTIKNSIFLIIIILLSLTACTKKYGRNDVEKYVRDTLGLKGFTVSRTCQDIVDSEGYTDHLWTVTESDGTVFNVLDDYYYSLEWVSNSLRDNWNNVHVRQYLGTADLTGFEIDDPGKEHPMAGVTLTGTYRSRSELHEYANRLNRLADGCADELSILFDIKYDHPYRTIGNYEKTEADYHGTVSKSSHVDCSYTEGNMINLLLDLRYEERLSEFTAEEIRDYVRGSDHAVGIKQSDGSWYMPDDLICSLYSYGISFPTIYEVLSRSAYPVTGTKDSFTFTGIDGSVYEMSESFIEDEWHYYIKDGVHVPMDAYFYDHFYVGKVKELTGIEVAEKWMIDRKEQSGK